MRIILIKNPLSFYGEKKGDEWRFYLFFSSHEPIIRLPESSKSYENIDNHYHLRPCSEERIDSIHSECFKSPIQTSDNEQNARKQIDSSHKGKIKG